MSRSFRKTPFTFSGLASEKKDKQAAHQATRSHFRTSLNSAADLDAFQFVEANKAHSDVTRHAKLDKHYFGLRVRHVGRALQALAAPFALREDRQLHKALAK